MRLAEFNLSEAPRKSVSVDRILDLPPFPPVARKLMALISQPNFRIPDVSQMVRSDAVFAGEVLRLANSAMMGLRYEVVSVMHAISVLGIDRLQSLVVTVAMRDFLRGGVQPRLLRLCWRHNLATALLAEALADACLIERSDGYIAGLLHDLGRLALVAAFPKEYATAMECWALGGEQTLRCEERSIGINHREAGLLLADKWGLPSVLRAVLCMHTTPRPAAFTVVRLISVACSLAERLGFTISQSKLEWDRAWLEEQLPPASWARLAPKVDELREQIPMKINQFECEFLPG